MCVERLGAFGCEGYVEQHGISTALRDRLVTETTDPLAHWTPRRAVAGQLFNDLRICRAYTERTSA